ncbi:hypothetical protein OEZ60_13875 [Defluviimonas sp. WL0024]|uniref:Glycerol-3-phosphate dehydrogenase n=1 Tax=Albidovulum salinarum TaxID=2984153 RepID=A0ABT2X572_9RHOB|nr:hypothetical protein [Defluviimonas sp. WL0024]MCU9849090.1 hypothetical protein [Defluviimonas sp. WL0024]
MSDLRTNPEIEDVLSSIRRLVSEDGRHRPAPAPERTPAPDDSDDKLVLTDALRVAGNEKELLPEAEEGADAALDTAADLESPTAVEALHADTGRQSLEATIAELEVAVARIGDDFEPDGSEIAVPDEALAQEEFIEDGLETDEPAAGDSAPGFAEASADVDLADEEGDRHTEASQDRYDDEPWAVFTDDDENPMSDAPDVQPESPDRDETAEAPDPDIEVEEAAEPGPARRLHLTAADAVADTGMTEPDSAVEPAAAPGQASAFWSDDVEGDVEDAEIEALRALVAELIRQELQGPLGERVTRNMRMLVRREIQRALDARKSD